MTDTSHRLRNINHSTNAMKARLRPIRLTHKEGLALVNGTQVTLACALLALEASVVALLTADVAATARLRAKLAAERGPVPLFDRGFTSIESLKQRCKAETGHEAPRQPRFSERVLKSAGVAKKKTKAA